MPDLRTDWLSGRTVLIAENRANRPNEFETSSPSPPSSTDEAATAAARTPITTCPFCPGNEATTPPARYEQFDDEGRWRIRSIPNKYPAVTETAGPAFGVHEVIVETTRHVDRTSSLTEIELANVLRAYTDRLRHWSRDDRLSYGLIFKNQGRRAGASLAHLHSQLIALPKVPPAVDAELRRAKKACVEHQSCAYCRLIREERASAARVVFDGGGYFAFCPYASLQPCEVWLLPSSHESSFERAMSGELVGGLAKILRALVVAVEALVPWTSFNLLLRTAPWKADCGDWFHWRIELHPRVNAIAGLESATGVFVNPVAPEHAAEQLRKWDGLQSVGK